MNTTVTTSNSSSYRPVYSREYNELFQQWLTLHSLPTRTNFEHHINRFLQTTSLQLEHFLRLDPVKAENLFSKYREDLWGTGLTEDGINRKLSAIRKFTKYAYERGFCRFKLPETSIINTVESPEPEQQESYLYLRDTALLTLVKLSPVKMTQIPSAKIGDFDPDEATLTIYCKSAKRRKTIPLQEQVVIALIKWLEIRDDPDLDQPLFCTLNNIKEQQPLSLRRIHYIVSSSLLKG
ncbi:MAG: Tyrosine recombinase XerC (plasmid) [Chroococcopsis gigantea SAG 12.99]|jgi:site-specific recombinase XerC|nr:Tyrosine recombinase XerC [Chroococcopsis gigantea SAG 12.99]